MKKTFVNALLAIASLAAVFLLVLAADRAAGVIRGTKKVELALLFPPNADVEYDTIEFNYKVHTNNLGFRGEDTTLTTKRKTRIIALGDSFTYGWGVDLDDTWVKRVETAFRVAGRDVEILNLGVPGAWPGQYADRAEELIPVLKPDVVLVGLLQGDDLEQCDDVHLKNAAGTVDTQIGRDASTSLRTLALRLFPNLSGVAEGERAALARRVEPNSARRWKSINGEWKRQALEFFDRLNDVEKARFRLLPERIQQGLLKGKLNPTNLSWIFPNPGTTKEASGRSTSAAYTRSPEMDLTSALTQRRIQVCTRQMERIREAADRAGARVVAISIPEAKYVTHSGWRRFLLDYVSEPVRQEWEECFVSTIADDAYRQACERARIPLVEVTAAFRERSKGTEAFYPYDTHFTPEGNHTFASLITPRLEPYLK